MDINGTRFHLLTTRADWLGDGAVAPGLSSGVAWAMDQTVTLAPRTFIFPPRPTEPRLTRDDRRGAGRDRFGNWYRIGAQPSGVAFLGADWREPQPFWPAVPSPTRSRASAGEFLACPPPAPASYQLAGLAVTDDHYLVIGMRLPQSGLLVFDLHSGGAPEVIEWPDGVGFEPFDLAPVPGGGVWILDATRRRVWMLDRWFRVRPLGDPGPDPGPRVEDFRRTGPVSHDDAEPCHLRPVTGDLALPLDSPHEPMSVEALPDGSVLVLDDDPARQSAVVTRYRAAAPPQRIALADVAGADSGVGTTLVRGHDFAFTRRPGSASGTNDGTLFVVGPDGNQGFAFALSAGEAGMTLALLPAFFPMRRFGGAALVGAGSDAFYDFERRWVPLAEQPRPAFVRRGEVRLPAAPSVSKEPPPQWAFDGREPGCVWHRLFLDACIPPGTSVTIESRAADRREELEFAPWRLEPAPYLRTAGAVPFQPRRVAGNPERAGTWELLFQEARGRYLQLCLTLRGSERATPRLGALRIYYPRFSYLAEYLPAVYREDQSSASFLDRYLANVEGILTALEAHVEQAQEYFDPWNTPAEYVAWLGSWVGAVPDLAWGEETQRAFVANAPRLFRERGTRAGMIRTLRAALEPGAGKSVFTGPAEGCGGAAFAVRVVESFLTRRAPGVLFGDPTDLLGPGSTADTLNWAPTEGATPLHERYRAYLSGRYASIAELNAAWSASFNGFDDARLLLSAVQPSQHGAAADWTRFVRAELGFTYAIVTAADTKLFQRFLTKRHRQIDHLNRAYGQKPSAAYASFAEVPLPGVLPARGPSLQDWILFVSSALPRERSAHRFSVLVPVQLDDNLETQQHKLAIARRVTAIERPAHTAFDVRLYWAAFRVGDARVGLETALGESSRFAAIVLGRGIVGEGYLGFGMPWDVTDRGVVGRNYVDERAACRRPEAGAL